MFLLFQTEPEVVLLDHVKGNKGFCFSLRYGGLGRGRGFPKTVSLGMVKPK